MTVRTLRRHLGCVAGSESKMNIRLQSSILERREAIAPFLVDRHPGLGVGWEEEDRQPVERRGE